AVWLLERWLRFDRRVEQTRDYLALLLAAVGSAQFAATLGALVLRANGNIDGAQMLPTLLNWWQGDALGMALVTPFLLIWAQPFGFGRGRWGRAGAALLASLGVVIGGVGFLGGGITGLDDTPRLYLMFALLPWAALRFGRHGASLLVMLTAVMAAIGVVKGN